MDVYAELAAVGEYFAVDVGPDPPNAPPLADLYAGGAALREHVRDLGARLPTTERRVAASILFQGLAARLWSPVVAGHVLVGGVPRLDPTTTFWNGGRLHVTDVALDGDPAEVIEHHLEPLVAAIKGTVRISARLLWGNASSALVGTVNVLIGQRPQVKPRATDLRDRLLEDKRLAGTGRFEPGAGFRRTTCCLYYRVPNGGLCGDCVLLRP